MTVWVAAPRDDPPFPVEALVEEEDTYLTLSAAAVLEPPTDAEHPVRVMTAAHAADEAPPGTLVVRHPVGRSLTFFAVVHKLSERPSWREAWVASALEAIARECSRRELLSLGLPLLGTVHGKLDAARSRALTRRALERVPTLERVWLVENPRRHDS